MQSNETDVTNEEPCRKSCRSSSRGGHQFIAVNTKLVLGRCTDIFSKRFINHSIII